MAPYKPGKYPLTSLEIFKTAPQFFYPGPKFFPFAFLFFRFGSDLKKFVVRKPGNNYWIKTFGKRRSNITFDDLPTNIIHENFYNYLLSKNFNICILR